MLFRSGSTISPQSQGVYESLKERPIRIYEPKLPNSLLEFSATSEEKGKHTTQKPVSLMEWLLKYYTKPGDTVLDPTMGSGSMGVACKNLGRRFVGIEQNEEIFEGARVRLAD